MNQKLKNILLVDDDEATNYIHKRVIMQMNCAENVVVKDSGIDALQYLKTETEGKYPQPDLIFLDVNMPAMDGWEFLEEYNNLTEDQLAKSIIVMLTTSLNPDDRDKANTIPLISGFLSKPLTEEKMEQVQQNFFNS